MSGRRRREFGDSEDEDDERNHKRSRVGSFGGRGHQDHAPPHRGGFREQRRSGYGRGPPPPFRRPPPSNDGPRPPGRIASIALRNAAQWGGRQAPRTSGWAELHKAQQEREEKFADVHGNEDWFLARYAHTEIEANAIKKLRTSCECSESMKEAIASFQLKLNADSLVEARTRSGFAPPQESPWAAKIPFIVCAGPIPSSIKRAAVQKAFRERIGDPDNIQSTIFLDPSSLGGGEQLDDDDAVTYKVFFVMKRPEDAADAKAKGDLGVEGASVPIPAGPAIADSVVATKRAPKEMSHPKRIAKDLERATKLAELLDEETVELASFRKPLDEDMDARTAQARLHSVLDALREKLEKFVKAPLGDDDAKDDEMISHEQRDEILLDAALAYLRRVHRVCYYSGIRCANEGEEVEFCPGMHLRTPLDGEKEKTTDSSTFSEKLDRDIDVMLNRAGAAVDAFRKAIEFESKTREKAIQAFCEEHTKQEDEFKFRCTLPPHKLFKAPKYVHKHIRNNADNRELIEKACQSAVAAEVPKIAKDAYMRDPDKLAPPGSPPPRNSASDRSHPRPLRGFRGRPPPMRGPPRGYRQFPLRPPPFRSGPRGPPPAPFRGRPPRPRRPPPLPSHFSRHPPRPVYRDPDAPIDTAPPEVTYREVADYSDL